MNGVKKVKIVQIFIFTFKEMMNTQVKNFLLLFKSSVNYDLNKTSIFYVHIACFEVQFKN